MDHIARRLSESNATDIEMVGWWDTCTPQTKEQFVRDIRDELTAKHSGQYTEFVILDEACAVLLSIEYLIAMARIRIDKQYSKA